MVSDSPVYMTNMLSNINMKIKNMSHIKLLSIYHRRIMETCCLQRFALRKHEGVPTKISKSIIFEVKFLREGFEILIRNHFQ